MKWWKQCGEASRAPRPAAISPGVCVSGEYKLTEGRGSRFVIFLFPAIHTVSAAEAVSGPLIVNESGAAKYTGM